MAKQVCPRLRDSASGRGGDFKQPRTNFFWPSPYTRLKFKRIHTCTVITLPTLSFKQSFRYTARNNCTLTYAFRNCTSYNRESGFSFVRGCHFRHFMNSSHSCVLCNDRSLFTRVGETTSRFGETRFYFSFGASWTVQCVESGCERGFVFWDFHRPLGCTAAAVLPK